MATKVRPSSPPKRLELLEGVPKQVATKGPAIIPPKALRIIRRGPQAGGHQGPAIIPPKALRIKLLEGVPKQVATKVRPSSPPKPLELLEGVPRQVATKVRPSSPPKLLEFLRRGPQAGGHHGLQVPRAQHPEQQPQPEAIAAQDVSQEVVHHEVLKCVNLQVFLNQIALVEKTLPQLWMSEQFLDMAPVQLDDDLTSRLSFVWYFAAWFKRQDV